MKYLIDENLSPRLIERLADKGLDAAHAAHRGLSGKSDPELWAYAYAEDRVVVTLNVSDFLMLAADSELHAGLIVIRRAGLSREEQWEWLEPVVDSLEEKGEPLINRVVEVTAKNRFSVRDLPER